MVSTTFEWRFRILTSVSQNRFIILGLMSLFSNSTISSKLLTYQSLTAITDGMRSRFSGRRAISFMMFANRTGSSLRRKMKDFCSDAFNPESKGKMMSPLLPAYSFNAQQGRLMIDIYWGTLFAQHLWFFQRGSLYKQCGVIYHPWYASLVVNFAWFLRSTEVLTAKFYYAIVSETLKKCILMYQGNTQQLKVLCHFK